MFNDIVAYAVAGTFVCFLICMALFCDAWLVRRRKRKDPWHVDLTDCQFPRSDDAYNMRATSNAPELVMCGGCGHNIEPGNCPGAERCEYFSRLGVD